MGNNDDDSEDITKSGYEAVGPVNSKTSDSSLLGFVANTLNTSAAWSRRVHCQPKSERSSKNCYNYATKNVKGDEDKTAMCRIAEIARYNKLKHEYILIDENGPAHMKYFTVKLYLCANEEYVGVGASIKKAQEAAAGVALKHTTLKTPPSRGRNKSDMDPVKLLNQVAYQLNLSVDYEYEMISVPIKIPNLRPKSSDKSMPPYVNSMPLMKPPFGQPPFSNAVPHTPPQFNAINFCSNVQLPSKPTNVFALNSGVLVSAPAQPPQPQHNQPFEVIQSMLYHHIFNRNNIDHAQTPYPQIPQPPTQPTQCDLHIHNPYHHHDSNPQRQSSSSSKRETTNSVNRLITPSNSNIFVQINAQPPEGWDSKKSNFNVIPSSIPPLFVISPFLLPFPNPVALFSAENDFHKLKQEQLPLSSFQLNNANDCGNSNIFAEDAKNTVGGKKNLRVFRITLKLGDGTQHVGIAADKLTSKTNAATQALKYLRPLLESLQEEIKKKGAPNVQSQPYVLTAKNEENLQELSQELDKKLSVDDITTDSVAVERLNSTVDSPSDAALKTNSRKKKKSIISLIHELAIQLRMDVEFEDVSIVGEAHNRQFTVRCRFVSPRTAEVVEADGHGTSKKWAKQNACQLVYEKIKELEKDPVYVANSVVKQTRKPAASYQTKAVKRKILVKQRRSDPQYGQWVNPVCRLMQVMQSNDKPDPIFKLLCESGHCKFKEFIVQVTCMDKVAEGRSQNKRLAKRAAADEMLRLLGYAKEMPQPGKSLLKKSAKPMDIGSFDTADLSPSPYDNFGEKFFNANETTDVPPSYKTSFSDACGTFADVDEILKLDEPSAGCRVGWNVTNDDENLTTRPMGMPVVRAESSSPIGVRKEEIGAAPIRKRRVTFNNQVSACPPPDDASYPEASIAPLKSEVLFVGNRLRKRGRDSKKVLTVEEKQILASVTDIFLKHKSSQAVTKVGADFTDNNWNGSPAINVGSENANALQSAKSFLDIIAKTHKFSVIYSDFPKTEQCFSLVTLGVDKPIVCPGSGNTEEEAHEDAALNAIKELSSYAQFNSTHS